LGTVSAIAPYRSYSDACKITTGTNSITVTYESSAHAKGIKNFKLVETYALVDDYRWQTYLIGLARNCASVSSATTFGCSSTTK